MKPAPEPRDRPGSRWQGIDGFHDLLSVHTRHPDRYPFFLESVAQGPPHARYDILFALPEERIIQEAAAPASDFLARLEMALQRERVETLCHAPVPFHGGWFVFLGYELAQSIEPSLALATGQPQDWPVALAVRCKAAIVRDHVAHQTWLVAESNHEAVWATLLHDLNSVETVRMNWNLPEQVRQVEEDSALYLGRIERVREYIRAGETYQVNLSRRWTVDFAEPPSPAALYARLRVANPAPFSGLAVFDRRHAIISSSPERLVSVHNGNISTRPIAGTWPRTGDSTLASQQVAALRQNPKERAEHVMLVDLERNDLGRVCRQGTVRADELLTVESYRHVHHLVSNISGELRPDVTPVDVIRAVFPGGTITGCPKVRTMQIIAEQEAAPRGAYTGSMGYINCDGSMDLNILIRTMTLRDQHLEWRAGGGIVADSDPQRELNETRAKAKGLLAALASQG